MIKQLHHIQLATLGLELVTSLEIEYLTGAVMERVQLHFIVIVMVAYWCISEGHKITPLMIRSNDGSIHVCPSEIMRDNARQLLKSMVSAKIYDITSTEPPTDGVTTNTPSTSATTTNVPRLLQSSLFGETGDGNFFDDYNENITGIVGMTIRAGSVIDSIQVTYQRKDGTTFTAPMHGGAGGGEYSFTLADGEKLTRMDGMTSNSSQAITMLTFYSNMNNVYGPYGVDVQTQFSVVAAEIVAFFGHAQDFGSSGDFLNALGVYYVPIIL